VTAPFVQFKQKFVRVVKYYHHSKTYNLMTICVVVLELLYAALQANKNGEANWRVFASLRCESAKNAEMVLVSRTNGGYLKCKIM
jgi:hypothetical protein